MLFRIWICACSDMGSTAPTNFPDSMSMSEGIPSPDSFSSSLRKLAKGNLLDEPFSARCCSYFNWKNEPEEQALMSKHSIRIPHKMGILYLVVSTSVISACVRGAEAEEARQGNETYRD